MVVDPERLGPGQGRLVVVQVAPLGLDQGQVGDGVAAPVIEVGDGLGQVVRRGQEVGIEDDQELGVGGLPPDFERSPTQP